MVSPDAQDGGVRDRRKFLVLEVLALMGTRLMAVFTGLFFWPWFSFNKETLAMSRSVALNAVEGYAPVFGVLHEIPLLGLFLFVMYASGDPLSQFGLRKVQWERDRAPLAAAAFGLLTLYLVLEMAGNDVAALHYARHFAPLVVVAMYVFVGSLSSEVVFRGYLIPRLKELTGSTALAIGSQALLCGLLAILDGYLEVAVSAGVAILLGLIFVKWRTLWPLVVCHSIFRFAVVYQLIQSAR